MHIPQTHHLATEQRTGEIPARVLVVSTHTDRLETIEHAVLGRSVSYHTARSPEKALTTLSATESNLILIDRTLGEQDGIALGARILDTNPGAVLVILDDAPTIDDTVLAMQTGASDMLDWSVSNTELRRRISVAAQRAESLRRREDKIARLKKLCGTLNAARDHVTGQVGDLCNDLLGAYQTLADQIGDVSVSSEFNTLLRQELDVESLLRTSLEYLLSKIGPTNAAIFLPASSGEFSLGAYINYDCPKEAAEVLLDEMANSFAPCFEDQTELLSLNGQQDLNAVLGESATWLGDSNALVISCMQDNECLAVLTVFRGASKVFTPEHRRLFDICSKLFGAQLGRVIRVHHRHLPEENWLEENGGFDDFGPEDINDLGPDFGNDNPGPNNPFSGEEWDEDEDDYGLAA